MHPCSHTHSHTHTDGHARMRAHVPTNIQTNANTQTQSHTETLTRTKITYTQKQDGPHFRGSRAPKDVRTQISRRINAQPIPKAAA